MKEEISDVMFVVEGKQIPALKTLVSVKSRVFRAMFSGNFKESNDKEVVIENTTYEAFKTFIQFLYCDDLVLKDFNDFELIGELYRLSDRYDVSRLADRITIKWIESNSNLFNGPKSLSDEDFQTNWVKIQSISEIAFELKLTKLMENVMTFIVKNLNHFLKRDIKLNQLNDLTDGRLFDFMANQCNRLKESLNQVKRYVCGNCGTSNQVGSTNCKHCNQLFCDFI